MDTSEDRVRSALESVDRIDFLPPDQREYVADDRALPIGYGQTNSQPRTVAALLALLDPLAGDHVLDVGSGSGWTTALLGVLVGPTGAVHGVELVPELVALGRSNLETYAMGWTSIEQTVPDELGLPAHAPYDRILVSAEAHDVPQALVDQLTPAGRMVVPVRGRLVVAQRDGDDLDVRRVGHFSFVPLR